MRIEIVLRLAVCLVQEAPVERPGPDVDAGRGFFRRQGVDFWGEVKAAGGKPSGTPPDGAARVSIWAEPIRQPDGRIGVYVPPKPVLEFLEHPTRERAREYLAWQEARAKKLKAAMEVLRDLRNEAGAGPVDASPPLHQETAPPALPPALPPAARIPAGEILYFKKKGCPWCLEEDKALAELARTHPQLRIRIATPESAPELWAEHEVKVVPTLVLPAPRGRHVTLRGYMSAERILKVLEEVNRAAP